jgi:hypothetical protein
MKRKQISEIDLADNDVVSWVVEEAFVKDSMQIKTAKKELLNL